MAIVNCDALTALISHGANACVSMFMPTHKSGREQNQDPIRLKNLLTEARARLVHRGISDREARRILGQAESLQDDVSFWTSRQDGLALFCAERFFRFYQLPLRLDTNLHINTRFYVRPLIQLLHGNSRFFVLALSQNHAQLFEATKYSIRDMHLESTLTKVKQALPGHAREQSLQFRTHARDSAGKGPAIFHGHGGAADVSKQDIVKYFQAVDRAVSKVLRDQSAPLVLACVGYLASLYELTNSYSELIKGKVPGNPNTWDDYELRDRAWELVSPIFSQYCDSALYRFEKASGTDRVVTDVRQVVLAAGDGHVDTLFLEKGRTIWGNIDSDLRAVHVLSDGANPDVAEAREELLDYAAARTLVQGGNVYALERERLPTENSAAAALLRYAA